MQHSTGKLWVTALQLRAPDGYNLLDDGYFPGGQDMATYAPPPDSYGRYSIVPSCPVPLNNVGADPSVVMGLCEGDCDADSDCSGSLLCFHRELTYTQLAIPGCTGIPTTFDWDYCLPGVDSSPGLNPSSVMGLCQGDCDTDAHCSGSLLCFQRDGTEDVPGCAGAGTSTWDYCVSESALWEPGIVPWVLVDHGTNPSAILGPCQGDCDIDADCAGDLTCFQRDGTATVPGCLGTGTSDLDYCISDPLSLPPGYKYFDFEAASLAGTGWTTGQLCAWLYMTGSPTSSNTGPSEAHGGDYYYYAEASTTNTCWKLEGALSDFTYNGGGCAGAATVTFWHARAGRTHILCRHTHISCRHTHIM